MFRFSHLSVREFLEDQEIYRAASVNVIVAEACLSHIIGVTAEIALLTPLLKYSSYFWAAHAQEAAEQRQIRLRDVLPKFLSGEQDRSSHFCRWHRWVERFDSRTLYRDWETTTKLGASVADIPSILLVVCAFNLYGVLSPGQWRQLAQRKPRNKDGATHQEVAVCYGGPELLEWHFTNKIRFQITDETVQAAAKNMHNGAEVMALLLNKCETEIQITKDIIGAAAGNWTSGGKVMALLLDKRGAEMQITGDIVMTIARDFDEAVFSILLDKCGAEIQITEGIIKAAARNWLYGGEVMTLLLDKCGPEIQITQDVVKAAAGNEEVMAMLLDKCSAEIQITEDVVEAAAGNEKVMALLLDKRGAEIQITEDVLKAAVGNERCGEVVALLLEKRRSETIAAITDKVCFTATACGQVDTLGFLCHLVPPETVHPSWNYVASFHRAAERGDVDRIKQLLQEPIPKDTKNSRGQTPLWVAASNGQTDIVKILAREKNIDVDSLSASGQSPIFWPSAYGYEDIVGILLSVGAKPHFIDDYGRTAVSMARQSGHERIVRVLLDAQSAKRRESVSAGKKLRWGRLSLSASLIFLGFILYQIGWIGGKSLLTGGMSYPSSLSI